MAIARKRAGYWQVTAGQEPKPLIWADKEIGGAVKAEMPIV